MLKYVIKRLLVMIPILMAISFIVLVLIDITPGDPARIMLGPQATEEEVQLARDSMGLNDPLPVRYVKFLYDAVRGDFGTSYTNGRDVWTDMMLRFPYTLFGRARYSPPQESEQQMLPVSEDLIMSKYPPNKCMPCATRRVHCIGSISTELR